MSSPPNPCDATHLLLTNNPPTPLEAASLQHEVDILTSRIARARLELDKMEVDLQKRRAALSPIRQMPAELVSQIIRHVAWGVLHSVGRDALVRMSLVCKSWRDAALLCHSQWAGIHIEKSEVREPVAFDKIVSWYRRAGSLPKTLEFSLGSAGSTSCYCQDQDAMIMGEQCEFLNPTLARLLAEGPNLNHILLKITQPACVHNLLQAIKAIDPPTGRARPWDVVRRLELDFSDPDNMLWDDDEDPGHSFFKFLPQVSSFSLYMPSSFVVFDIESAEARGVPILVPPSLLQNLTSFTVECDWEGSHILDMLSNCPNVETLEIRLGGNDIFFNDNEVPASRVPLPRLHTLHLRELDNGSVDILNRIRTPILRNLQLGFRSPSPKSRHTADGDFRKTFEQFVKESTGEGTIRSLELKKAFVIPPMELADAIVLLPSLIRLALADFRFAFRDVLCALIKRKMRGDSERGGQCFSHLEELELVDYPVEISAADICGIVECLPFPKLRLTVIYSYFRRDINQVGAKEEDFLAFIYGQLRHGVSARLIARNSSNWLS